MIIKDKQTESNARILKYIYVVLVALWNLV